MSFFIETRNGVITLVMLDYNWITSRICMSPYLFALVMDKLTITFKRSAMVILVVEIKEGMDTKLKLWTDTLEYKAF